MIGFGFSVFTQAILGAVGWFKNASLNLDFTSGVLDPRITFTRASTGTRFNSSGVLESIAINGPRFDYNPVTLAPKGLLIEEQRTNLLLQSASFDTAVWTKSSSTITVDAVTSPIGSVDADKVIETATTTTHSINQVAASTQTSFCCSVYVKAAERRRMFLRLDDSGSSNTRAYTFDVISGTITSGTDGTTGTLTSSAPFIIPVGNGWFRCGFTGVFSVAPTSVRLQVFLATDAGGTNYAGDGSSGLFVWGTQLEAGAFATSYIPTAASQVTRAADIATMTGTNFSSWYNQSEGTLFAEASFMSASAVQSFIAQAASDSSNYLAMYRDSSTQYLTARVRSGGVDQAFMYPTSTVIAANTVYKQTLAYKQNDFATASNGANAVTDTSGTVPNGMTVLGIGAATYTSTVQLNGHILRIAYYNRRLTNAELTAITS